MKKTWGNWSLQSPQPRCGAYHKCGHPNELQEYFQHSVNTLGVALATSVGIPNEIQSYSNSAHTLGVALTMGVTHKQNFFYYF